MVEMVGKLPGCEAGAVDFVVLEKIGTYEVAVGRGLNGVGAGRVVEGAAVGKIGTMEELVVRTAKCSAVAAEVVGVVAAGDENAGAG
jgi:hypothetical protein